MNGDIVEVGKAILRDDAHQYSALHLSLMTYEVHQHEHEVHHCTATLTAAKKGQKDKSNE